MRDQFPAIGAALSLFDGFHEPCVVVDQALDSVGDELLNVAALFGGEASQLVFEFGNEVHLHDPSVTAFVAMSTTMVSGSGGGMFSSGIPELVDLIPCN